jgi:hypothetical protein
MTLRGRLLRLLLLALWVAALAWLLRDAVRGLLATPLVFIYQLARALYDSLPEVLLWLALMLALFGFALWAWFEPVRQWLFAHRFVESAPALERREGRVAWLTRWVKWRRNGPYSRHYLHNIVADLALKTLAHRQRLSTQQARSAIEAGRIEMPPEVETYLRAGLLPWPTDTRGRLQRLAAQIGLGRYVAPPDIETDHALDYIEAQLEGVHDR